ncbi:hypothetical protein WICPIJ_000984 [Wickerhamomyces pijperi]|uniref:Uncharacterized protein n=1 Tax=Wickerhamomyces pijperi TaxID=599730 RepID=A0A9P8QEI4_WICPI|nr:hypothetical protein WICPIJ_000984 [Wickerhamomyces pijperi]
MAPISVKLTVTNSSIGISSSNNHIFCLEFKACLMTIAVPLEIPRIVSITVVVRDDRHIGKQAFVQVQ